MIKTSRARQRHQLLRWGRFWNLAWAPQYPKPGLGVQPPSKWSVTVSMLIVGKIWGVNCLVEFDGKEKVSRVIYIYWIGGGSFRLWQSVAVVEL